MIVERWTFATKDGCWGKMIDLLKAERDRSGGFEIHTCSIGAHQAEIATEQRFESLAELEKSWAEFGNTPEGRKFIEAFQSLASDSLWASREIWNVVE
jgi:hypothetical protein